MNRDFRLIGCLTKWQCWSECSVGRSIGWKDWCICRSGGQLVRRLLVCSFGWLVAYLCNCFFFFFVLYFLCYFWVACVLKHGAYSLHTLNFSFICSGQLMTVFINAMGVYLCESTAAREIVIIYWRIKKF